MASEAPKTLTGSCHCGFVKFTVKVPPGPITVNRCNCTYCQKRAVTNFYVQDHTTEFNLISPADPDEQGDYVDKPRPERLAHRYFCKTCGVQTWTRAEYEMFGKEVKIFALNFAMIDQPQEGIDLKDVKIRYLDGLHDNFKGGFKEEPWSGGLV